MAQKLFHFAVTNDRTGETLEFKGQGDNASDAFKEGLKLCGDTFRPKNDGKHRDSVNCKITLRDGTIVLRHLEEWESDLPYVAPAPKEESVPVQEF